MDTALVLLDSGLIFRFTGGPARWNLYGLTAFRSQGRQSHQIVDERDVTPTEFVHLCKRVLLTAAVVGHEHLTHLHRHLRRSEVPRAYRLIVCEQFNEFLESDPAGSRAANERLTVDTCLRHAC